MEASSLNHNPTTSEWRPCVTGYEASDDGRVRNARTLRERSVSLDTSGYRKVTLRGRTYRVCQLVALAFLGPKPDGLTINHKRGKAHDDAASLEYVTMGANHRHAYGTGLRARPFGALNPNARLSSEDVAAIRHRASLGNFTYSRLAREYGVGRTTITEIIKCRSWKS